VPVLVPPKHGAGTFQVNQAVWRTGDLYELGEIEEPDNTEYAQGDLVRVGTKKGSDEKGVGSHCHESLPRMTFDPYSHPARHCATLSYAPN